MLVIFVKRKFWKQQRSGSSFAPSPGSQGGLPGFDDDRWREALVAGTAVEMYSSSLNVWSAALGATLDRAPNERCASADTYPCC